MRSNFSYFSRRYVNVIRPTYRSSNEMNVNPLMSIYVWCISIKANRKYGIWFLSDQKWHVHALIAKGQSAQPAQSSSLLQKDQPFFHGNNIQRIPFGVCGKYGRGEVDLPKSVCYWVSLPIFSLIECYLRINHHFYYSCFVVSTIVRDVSTRLRTIDLGTRTHFMRWNKSVENEPNARGEKIDFKDWKINWSQSNGAASDGCGYFFFSRFVFTSHRFK